MSDTITTLKKKGDSSVKQTPKGFVEITQEQYDELNKQDNQNNEEKE